MSAHITAPTQQVSEWLSNFGNALDRADFDAAANLFQEDGYWRDLVSLTWNIKTLEGRENIKEMLKATVSEAKPGRWQAAGDATSDNGVIGHHDRCRGPDIRLGSLQDHAYLPHPGL
jgi:putative flavoprotein involved in K+ transport